jgi:hypothetical protein
MKINTHEKRYKKTCFQGTTPEARQRNKPTDTEAITALLR